MINKNLSLKATAKVTGKRQITIPKEICKILDIENGNEVIFKVESGRILFETGKLYKTCFGCHGSGKIENKPCFLCNGSGQLENDLDINLIQSQLDLILSNTLTK